MMQISAKKHISFLGLMVSLHVALNVDTLWK